MLLVAFMVSGCSTMDYFKRAENQQVLMDAGVTCFASDNYTIGIEYGLTRDGETITNATQVGGVIGCDNKKFSVICDVTKKPGENPCPNIRSFTEDPPPNADAEVAPEVIPEPVPAVIPEVIPEVTPEKVVEEPIAIECLNRDVLALICEIRGTQSFIHRDVPGEIWMATQNG